MGVIVGVGASGRGVGVSVGVGAGVLVAVGGKTSVGETTSVEASGPITISVTCPTGELGLPLQAAISTLARVKTSANFLCKHQFYPALSRFM